MLLISASVGPSPIHGTGCFASESVRKGQRVWVFDPRIDVRVPVSELPNLPRPAQDFLNMYGYVTIEAGEQVIILCGDHSKHMNHSSDPNVVESEDLPGIEIAARDIAAGEELTCDYYTFDLDAARKLG